jgi:hypothetical protein
MLVAADGQEYASIAVALATSEETRRRVADAMTAAVSQYGIVRFAQTVEKHATDALALVEGTPHG